MAASRRITQTDIASAAGVHNSTVSLALRNSPAIPEATRRAIQEVARTLGYIPDPALQALVAYRSRSAAVSHPQTIAYVTHWQSRYGWRSDPQQARFCAGAERKAAATGYRLEHFSLADAELSPRRLTQILYHRGIAGILLASWLPGRDDLAELGRAPVSIVKIGANPLSAPVHRVMDDQAGSTRQAMRRILAAGYSRVGMIIPQGWCDGAEESSLAGFLVSQFQVPARDRIAPLILGAPCPDNDATLRMWLLQHHPDAVLGMGSAVRLRLERLGYAVPEDFAYVDLCEAGGATSGMCEHPERVGEVAVETLSDLMQRNITGIPAIPNAVLIGGTWHEGTSLPAAACEQPLVTTGT